MYELDKAAFGRFLAQLRREKGMTQKELAATLYVSDKAVSKWERGLMEENLVWLGAELQKLTDYQQRRNTYRKK